MAIAHRKVANMYGYESKQRKYVLLKRNKPLLTPGGKIIQTSSKTLIEEAVQDVKRFGEDPRGSTSTYSCLCSYVDFAEEGEKAVLVGPLVESIDYDPVFSLPPGPPLALLFYRAFSQPYLRENGIVLGMELPSNFDEIKQWAKKECFLWSKHQLTATTIASASYGSVLIAMGIIQRKADLPVVAQGFCLLVREHAIRQLLGSTASDGVSGILSHRADTKYCNEACCCFGANDYPVDTLDNRCGIVQDMKVLQRFAQVRD